MSTTTPQSVSCAQSFPKRLPNHSQRTEQESGFQNNQHQSLFQTEDDDVTTKFWNGSAAAARNQSAINAINDWNKTASYY